MYTTILTLYKQGVSQRQIAKTTNTHGSVIKLAYNKKIIYHKAMQ